MEQPLDQAHYEREELKDMIGELYHIQSRFMNLRLPSYLTETERIEWNYIKQRYERDLTATIDKADVELSREGWED